MPQVRSALLTSALIMGLAAGTNVFAGPLPAPGLSVLPENSFYLSFNEDGHGNIALNGGSATPLTGTQISDPSNQCPSCSLVLAYSLPEPVITGTVAISEPAAAGGDIIGALRFTDATGIISGTPAGTGAVMIYYEDTELPANLTAGNFLLGPTETSWAGYSTFDYIPGGVPYPQNNQYHYSGPGGGDGVPEPPSLVLLVCTLAAMGLLMYRRQKQS